MSFVQRKVAHCDQCDHEWIMAKKKPFHFHNDPKADLPTHCAKCKSRQWNAGEKRRHQMDNTIKSRVEQAIDQTGPVADAEGTEAADVLVIRDIDGNICRLSTTPRSLALLETLHHQCDRMQRAENKKAGMYET